MDGPGNPQQCVVGCPGIAEPAGPEVVVGSVIIRLEPGASAVRIASVVHALMAAS